MGETPLLWEVGVQSTVLVLPIGKSVGTALPWHLPVNVDQMVFARGTVNEASFGLFLDSQNSFSCGSVAVGEILGFSCLCPSHCQVPSASSLDVSLLLD